MSRTLAAIVGGAAGAVALVGILLLICCFCIFRKRTISTTSDTGSSDPSVQVGKNAGVELTSQDARPFHIEELSLATKGFSDKNLIGQGKFGEVYKGLLHDGMLVAIKRRSAVPSQEFIDEKIGDQCGGWLEIEEETLLKNHMRWARIKVKGPLEEIPRFVEIADGDIVFSLPIWVEAPARYKMVNEARKRKKKDWKYPMDIEELEVEGTWDGSRDVSRGNGSTWVGPMETPSSSRLNIIMDKNLGRSGFVEGQSTGPPLKPKPPKPTIIKTAEPFIGNIHTHLKNTGQNQDLLVIADELESIRIITEKQKEGRIMQCVERQIVQGEKNIVGSSSMEIEPWEGEETQESNPKQMMYYSEIEPLQVDESISEEEAKEKATLWICQMSLN
ncbi:hypothetical protein H5410_009824 [Solanum commersonii]|uniref:DUF4283 domain-containing protein n=1 Tax=Solanum commersonii TaxID=4109 RepID=A0A9J6AJ08_SOLCO|nr:hypothetical protein H5410_009824 [Solanum commersonii]